MNIEEQIENYKTLPSAETQLNKARIEEAIWASSPQTGPRRKFLKDLFGGVQNDYEIRAILLGAGDIALPLWNRIDAGMSLYTAIRIFRTAKTKSFEDRQFFTSEYVQKAIDNYDSIPLKIRYSNGTAVHRSKPKDKHLPRKKTSELSIETPNGVKQLKAGIQLLVDGYMSSFSNIEEFDLKEMKNELLTYISDSIETVNSKLLRKSKSVKHDSLHINIGRTNFINALNILALKESDFQFGKKIDFLKVMKAKRSRQATCHPDVNSSSEALSEFHAISEAYKILEQYNDQIK